MIAQFRYQYLVVQYEHHLVRRERLNIGVVSTMSSAAFLSCRFLTDWSRVITTFPKADPTHLSWVVESISEGIHRCEVGQDPDLTKIMRTIIPDLDGSIQFPDPCYGLSRNTPDKLINELFETYVA